jgi:hypothetical protein
MAIATTFSVEVVGFITVTAQPVTGPTGKVGSTASDDLISRPGWVEKPPPVAIVPEGQFTDVDWSAPGGIPTTGPFTRVVLC